MSPKAAGPRSAASARPRPPKQQLDQRACRAVTQDPLQLALRQPEPRAAAVARAGGRRLSHGPACEADSCSSERTIRNLPLGSGGISSTRRTSGLEAVQHGPQCGADLARHGWREAVARQHQHLDPVDRPLHDLVALHARQMLDGAGQVVGRDHGAVDQGQVVDASPPGRPHQRQARGRMGSARSRSSPGVADLVADQRHRPVGEAGDQDSARGAPQLVGAGTVSTSSQSALMW